MRRIEVKADESLYEKYLAILAFFGIASDNKMQNTKDLIEKLYERVILDKLSLSSGDNSSDIPPCMNRLKVVKVTEKGKTLTPFWACVNRPPKFTKIETLDICRVCFKRQHNLPAVSPIKLPEPDKDPLDPPKISEQEQKAVFGKTTGKVYCARDTMLVFASKCESLCKETDCRKNPHYRPTPKDQDEPPL